MSRKAAAVWSLVFLLLAPGVVAGLLPWSIAGGRPAPARLGIAQAVAAAMILLGLAVLLDAFARFVWQGRGTPAPVLPTERLVVSGLYRRVRNPMYLAVIAIILGQALLAHSGALLLYAGVVWSAFHLFVLAYEEPTLRPRYGDEYERFTAAVPRWLPRLRPWSPAAKA